MRFRQGRCLISFFLIVAVLLGVVSPVYAASDLTISDEGIGVLKKLEGFSKYAYFDYSQWSIGYGTGCNKNEYPNGITEEKAEKLLRNHLKKFETTVNKFAKEHGLKLKQNQFDALVSFSYNVGTAWMYNTNQVVTQAVIDGQKGNDFIFAITRWCMVTENGTKKISTGLIKRRLIEANMYLNGKYVNSVPSNYKYIVYDDNMEGAITDTRVQGYDNKVSDVLRATPSKSGYVFLGWYTEAKGGQWITRVGPDTKLDKLYGHWQEGTDNTSGVAAKYVRYGTGKKIYGYPSHSSTVKGTLAKGESATIVADYIDSKGIKWGKISTSKWVCLAETTEKADGSNAISVEVKVTNSTVNVRSGPGTGYDKTGTLTKGKKVQLTEVLQNGDYKWGKFKDGWIRLDYTNYDQVLAGNSGSTSDDYADDTTAKQEKIVATGKVIQCTSLRIRAGAGTGYDAVGALYTGDKVEIYEMTIAGGLRWGRISSGWICLNYVELDNSVSTVAITGKVVNCTGLNVRAAPGVSNAKVGVLAHGAEVTVYEQISAEGGVWGRIDGGWVFMGYISPVDGSGDDSCKTAVVTGTDTLRVRSGPGTQYTEVNQLKRGTVVIVTETIKAEGDLWGKVEQGWINLKYIRENEEPVPEELVIKTVNTKSLRIRAGAGTNYATIGGYVMGDQVVLLEQTVVGGIPWGRTELGWICLDLVI